MKEFRLNNEVWNETEMRNLINNCENIILSWEKHSKKLKNDDLYNFWNYAVSRIKDVKQIFELILKSNDIYIWFQGVDFNDARLTVCQAQIINAYTNDNSFNKEVCLLYMWELLCRHFSEQPCTDNEDAVVIFPYYKKNMRVEWDVQGIMNEYEQLKKEGRL